MRKMTVAIVLTTTALSGPALARDKAWYVGIEGGGLIAERYHFDLRDTSGNITRNDIGIKHSAGFDVDGNVGYDFGLIRTEFEVGYKQANVSDLSINQATANFPDGGGGFGTLGPLTKSGAYGFTRSLSFMANAMLDVGDDNGWSAFAGGGAGVARVELSQLRYYRQTPNIADDSDTHFAWQLIAGVRRKLTDHVDLGLKYRFFNVPDLKFHTVNGLEFSDRLRTHSLLLTLAYNFGERAAPPPPPPPPAQPLPPPPPPPLAPQPLQVTPGPFIIFFDWDKADITSDATQILDRAIEQFKTTGQASVALAGHTDKSGTARYNMGLSERRAMNTKAYMVAHGVPDSVIAAQGFGETRPLVDTADGVREPQNRRVEITFAGSGSGSGPSPDAVAPVSSSATTPTTSTTSTDAPPPPPVQ